MDKDFLLSIITPAYNRGELLKECFASLCEQTDRAFEWIIVDDGSVDNTRQVVESFLADPKGIRISYVHKENGGKHTALNASHPYVHGTHVLILDSDDRLVDTAVAEVHEGWTRYGRDPEIGIVVFLRGQTRDRPLAYAEEGVPLDVLRHKRVVLQGNDFCETIPAALFLKYPFPVFENEKYLSEGVLWKQIGLDHRCVYVNSVIYLCEYRSDGLTRMGRALRIRNPKGGMLNASMNMHRRCSLKQRIKSGLLYDSYGFFAGLRPGEILLGEKENIGIKTLCLLPGYAIYRVWKRKYAG